MFALGAVQCTLCLSSELRGEWRGMNQKDAGLDPESNCYEASGEE